MQGVTIITRRLEQLATGKAAHQLEFDALWAAYKAAPAEDRADLFGELNESRKRHKTIRAQVIALEAMLGVAAGQHRLDILRKEVDLAESKRQEAQKAWVAAPEGWLWDVLQQEVDYIREELKELRSRRNKLQDQLDTETEGATCVATRTVESIQQHVSELPASRKCERLRCLERLLGHLREAKINLEARQDQISDALFKIVMAETESAKEEGYHDYLNKENDAARYKLAILDDDLSTRAGEAACVVVDNEHTSTLPVPHSRHGPYNLATCNERLRGRGASCPSAPAVTSRRKLEVLDECLQYLHLKQAAMTTRLEEICTAQSFAPKDSKLQVVLEVESESLDNRRKRLQSVLMDMEDERQYAVLHLAALSGGVGNADSYRDRVANLPTLLSFEEYCAAHPFLTLVSDKGLPTTPGDGVSLMKSIESGHLTQHAYAVVKHLVNIVSEIYLDPSNTSYKAAVEESMGPDFVGPRLESVATMMDRVQAVLLRYLNKMGGRARFSFTQGQSETTRVMKLQKQDGSTSNVTILILEGRAKRGCRTEIVRSICDAYIRETQSLFKTSAHVHTLLPALGMEVSGSDIRFHALSYTDRICQNSLTPGYHFHDLWKDDRRYMENLVKIMNGVGELCHEFSEQMAPYTEA